MNEHRNIEVVVAEHCRDVRQMHPDLVARGIILLGLDIDLDGATVWEEGEVMSRGFAGESHCMVAAIVNACSVIIGFLKLIVHGAFHGWLGLCSCGQK